MESGRKQGEVSRCNLNGIANTQPKRYNEEKRIRLKTLQQLQGGCV